MFSRRVFVNTAAALGAVALVASLAACSSSTTSSSSASSSASTAPIQVVAAESQYGDVASIIGGDKVKVTSLVDSPSVDPHDIGATPEYAKALSAAQIVVENGAGYDDWMDSLVGQKTVVNAHELIGVPKDVKNPHLWYGTETMPKVASALVDEYSKLQPENANYFKVNEATFNKDMQRYTSALTEFKASHPNTPVAVTEPVSNMMLDAAGADIKTPWNFQAAIMNGNDPSAQDSATQTSLFKDKKIKAFLYNEQVTSAMTKKLLGLAKDNKIPTVAVYEIMPKGMNYVDWMVSEVKALNSAVADGTSTTEITK